MAIFGFIGNYFWTHYFFNLLGAAYTLPSHRLNGVSRTTAGGPTATHKQPMHSS
jgi:cycloeucalenol cycloisomerase